MQGRSAWQGDGAIAAAVAVSVGLAQLPSFDRSVVPMDEGQLIAIAGRLLDGQALYRDVYTGIFPGVYWATAALLRVFGEDVVVTRWAQLALNAAVAGVLWAIGRRMLGRAWALLPPLLFAALIPFAFPALTMVNYSSLSLACALFALLFLLRHLESGRLADALICGAWLGACGVVKQNFGGLAVLAAAAGFAWAAAEDARVRRAAGLAALAVGALVGLAMLAALAAQGAAGDFVYQTLVVIFESQLDAYNAPLPPILGAHPADDPRFTFLYIPSALYEYLIRGERFLGLELSPVLRGLSIRLVYGATIACLLAGALLCWLERRSPERARVRATRCAVLFAIAFFFGIFPLAIWSHLAFALPPVLLLTGLIAQRVDERLAGRASVRRAWRQAFAALALFALLVLARVSLDLRRWYDRPLGLPRASLYVDTRLEALLRGGTIFLARCANPAQPVFVAPHMPILYFLADRRNPTPYDLVIPGDVRGDVIVERLEATATRCVVYSPRPYAQFAPFVDLFPQVERYLRANYERSLVFGVPEDPWYGLVRR